MQRAYYVSRQDIARRSCAADGRGGLVVFAAGENQCDRQPLGLGPAPLAEPGRPRNGPLVSFTHADGTAGLMARDPLGGVWAHKQRHDGTWQGWQALGGMRVAQIPVVAPQAARPPWRWATTASCTGSRRRASTAAGNVAQALPVLDGVTGSPAAARADGRLCDRGATSAGALYYHAPTAGRQGQAAPECRQDWRRVPARRRRQTGWRRPRRAYFRQRGENHLIRLVEAGDTSDTNMDWSEPADLGVPYIGRPAVGVDARGNVMLAILERPGGALWLVERGKPAKLDALAASPPAMSVIGDTVYIVARAAGARSVTRCCRATAARGRPT